MASDERYLTPDEERMLLRIARESLERYVRTGEHLALDDDALTPALREKHGAFVTLRNRGVLRGCIGYTANREPLAQAVRDNAINAASADPRFEPVRPDELADIAIEVSALCPGDTPESPFIKVHALGGIVLGRDGLFIQAQGGRGGLLLPQVPVEQGWDLDQFLGALCRKAGYPPGAWEDPEVALYRFSAQVFSEGEETA